MPYYVSVNNFHPMRGICNSMLYHVAISFTVGVDDAASLYYISFESLTVKLRLGMDTLEEHKIMKGEWLVCNRDKLGNWLLNHSFS